jgi:hypothetical protein
MGKNLGVHPLGKVRSWDWDRGEELFNNCCYA